MSQQMVLFAVERRKAWRMLQSKAGIENKDYLAQKKVLAKIDKAEIPMPAKRSEISSLIEAELAALN